MDKQKPNFSLAMHMHSIGYPENYKFFTLRRHMINLKLGNTHLNIALKDLEIKDNRDVEYLEKVKYGLEKAIESPGEGFHLDTKKTALDTITEKLNQTENVPNYIEPPIYNPKKIYYPNYQTIDDKLKQVNNIAKKIIKVKKNKSNLTEREIRALEKEIYQKYEITDGIFGVQDVVADIYNKDLKINVERFENLITEYEGNAKKQRKIVYEQAEEFVKMTFKKKEVKRLCEKLDQQGFSIGTHYIDF